MDALIFDVGGVLLVPHAEPICAALGMAVDFELAEQAHYHGARALDACNADQDDERYAYLEAYARCLGVPDKDLAETVPRLQALFSASSLDLWRQEVRGSVEGLRALCDGTRKLAIVSNADGTVEEQLRRGRICQVGEGLGVPVLAIIDSTVVGVAKPAAEIFRHALEPLAIAPDRAAYIGDTRRYDVAGARAAGLKPIHFDPYELCPERHDHEHLAALSDLL
ncbi:MAG TPA: HAD family hydrolase [Chloroflexota bacterium]|jgi:putative hydrolase of the HAD superfamily